MGKQYIDPLLTKDALGYKPHGMVNEEVLPVRTVKKDTGKIANYGAQNIRLVTSMKSPEGETPVVRMNTQIDDGWKISAHALKALVTDVEMENQDLPFNARRDKSRMVQDLLGMQREVGLSLFMRNDSNFTNNLDLTGGDQWDTVNGDIVDDINTAIQTVSDAIGVPDTGLTVLVSRQVQRKLAKLADIEALVYGTTGMRSASGGQKSKGVKAQDLMEAFEVAGWIVADGHYNTAKDGQAPVLAPIWGNGFWIFNRQTAPELLGQPFGFTMRKKASQVVDRWRDTDRMGDWVRAHDAWDQWIVNEEAAYFIKNPMDNLPDLP
jgi:hypothetical protein